MECRAAKLIAEVEPKLLRGGAEHERFMLELYRRALVQLLSRIPLDHEVACTLAQAYFIARRELAMVLILLGRDMAVRKIVQLCEGYRPLYTDFADTIARHCTSSRASRCILAINFEHRLSLFTEMRNLNLLYMELDRRGIVLSDVIRAVGGDVSSLIYPINPGGYNFEKQHKK